IHGLDGSAVVFHAISLPSQNALVALSVEVGKATGELQLLAFDIDAAIGELIALDGVFRQMVCVDGEEPAYIGALVLQEAGRGLFIAVMHFVMSDFAEDEMQHVVKMHADIGGDTT